ncbi:MAG: CHAT domain-containing protein [Coleofasciculus sp. S288]|nr:CHAT domain-containing protein [Coleofasciculus sp. S288]
MQLQQISLTTFIALLAALTIGDFPLLRNQTHSIQVSPVFAQTPNVERIEADRLFALGMEQYQTSQFQAALQSWQQALFIYQQLEDRSSEEKALGNLGLAYLTLGDYNTAIEYFQQDLVVAREIPNRRGEGNALGNLSSAYKNLGDYAKAIEYSQQHLAIAKEIQDRQSEGMALGNLGSAYRNLGDYAKAIEYFQQQLAIAKEIQDRQSEGTALGNLGSAYSFLGDYAKAIEYSQQWLEMARVLQDRRSEGTALGNLGIAYYSLRDFTKAIEYHEQWLEIAREIQDLRSEGTALGNLGSAYSFLGDYTKAIEYHQQQLAIAREIHDLYGEGTALNNLGVALINMGRFAEAENILRDGIEARESLRELLGSNDAYKVTLFEQQARTYRHLQKVLIVQNKIEAALEIAERGRARAFVELLARRFSSNSGAQLHIEPPTIEQIRQIAVEQNATLVEYSIVEDELYIWVIQPNGNITFRQVDLRTLKTSLTDATMRSQLAAARGTQAEDSPNTALLNVLSETRGALRIEEKDSTNRTATTSAATSLPRRKNPHLQQIYQLLIKPIAHLLPADAGEHVIFIPQGELFLAPFPAFQDESGKYLIEKHTIRIAPSIQVLQLTQKQRERLVETRNFEDVLVVGNPTMPTVVSAPGEPPQQLPSLPGAEREAEAIAQIFNTKAFIGQDATETAIAQLMPRARIIHLATHGLLDDVRGLGSAIALAPSGEDDGLLTAEQLLNMTLNTELVVLSACNTGRGRITGDGVLGLSRSLISAGVPSVIVSLWAIPDAPTASLMTQFYQNLQQNPDKAQALRTAMLTVMQQNPEPKDWAAFILIGEAE